MANASEISERVRKNSTTERFGVGKRAKRTLTNSVECVVSQRCNNSKVDGRFRMITSSKQPLCFQMILSTARFLLHEGAYGGIRNSTAAQVAGGALGHADTRIWWCWMSGMACHPHIHTWQAPPSFAFRCVRSLVRHDGEVRVRGETRRTKLEISIEIPDDDGDHAIMVSKESKTKSLDPLLVVITTHTLHAPLSC